MATGLLYEVESTYLIQIYIEYLLQTLIFTIVAFNEDIKQWQNALYMVVVVSLILCSPSCCSDWFLICFLNPLVLDCCNSWIRRHYARHGVWSRVVNAFDHRVSEVTYLILIRKCEISHFCLQNFHFDSYSNLIIAGLVVANFRYINFLIWLCRRDNSLIFQYTTEIIVQTTRYTW